MKNLLKMVMFATAIIGTSMDASGMRRYNADDSIDNRLLSTSTNSLNTNYSESDFNLTINVEGTATENTVVAPDANKLLSDMLAIYEVSSLNEKMKDRRVLSLRNDKNEVLLAEFEPLNINTTLKSSKMFASRKVISVSDYEKISGNFFNPINDTFYDVFLGRVTIECSTIRNRIENTYYHLYCTVNENPEIDTRGCGCGCCTIF